MPQRFNAADLASVLPPGGRTLVLGFAGESLLLAEAVMQAGPALGAMRFTGAFIPGVNTRTYLANPDCRVETFFMTPELKAVGAGVEFLPLCYHDILRRLRTVRIDTALFMAAPPDAEGLCSFGPAVDFLAELWPSIPVRIAHLNPETPRTRGHAGIPFSEITAFIEAPQPLLGKADTGDDPVAVAIAGHIASFIGDGATLQLGIGKIPAAVLRALTDRRGLRVHSGLIVDEVAALERAGALAPGVAVTAGCALGSAALYEAIEGEAYAFQPVSVTHDVRRIAGIERFVAVNSALQLDLYGQAYAEFGPSGLMSGPGGASDYARAARLSGGLMIVALPASAVRGTVSRIVAPGAGAGPVSLGRTDIDLVVTEFGAADLRGKGHDARAEALIAVAPPAHRDALIAAWRAVAAKF